MCKKLLVLSKSFQSRTDRPALVSNTEPLPESMITKINYSSVGEKRRTCWTFPMARAKCLMGDFTNLYRIYKTHQKNV